MPDIRVVFREVRRARAEHRESACREVAALIR
jgi:hypothetical protein